MNTTKIQDAMSGLLIANNAMIEIKSTDHPNIPRRVLGRVWTDIRALSAKLEILNLLDAGEHIDAASIE